LVEDGTASPAGAEVLTVEGSASGILEAERTALNLLQRLSGVATLTAKYVEAAGETTMRVLDTRKTTPGLRLLEKEAVVHGGGHNLRIGLYDAILIKENHIAAAGGIANAINAARAARPDFLIECEVRDLDELEQALEAQAPRVLLDNMDLATPAGPAMSFHCRRYIHGTTLDIAGRAPAVRPDYRTF
jgi:nicotinate-nucleotide pyrophosphorylase (carboxylating)